jgi:outer membrane protein assembly factor BamD (BamD/ComL family)
MPPATRRWGALIPGTILVACCAARLWTLRASPSDPMPLYERASRAYSEGHHAEAAEYARHALARGAVAPLRGELLVLRGESLMRAGQARTAAETFEAVLAEPGPSPYVAQALFGAMRARLAAGELDAAAAARSRLLREFADSPWARRAMPAPSPPPS